MKLNEVEMQHRSNLWKNIQPYVGKGYFIHFGDTTKVGVKVNGKFHSDPHGVYMYGLDWLVTTPNFIKGDQFATTRPHWSIFKLHPDPNGIVFSHLTYDSVDDIAHEEGWAQWDDFKARRKTGFRATKTPADLYWQYIKACGDRLKGFPSQRAALRGVPYIYDDGIGIIHSNEADQIVIFDPRALKVVATGNQGDIADDKLMSGQRYSFIELLKKFRGEYGGDLIWKNKLPSLGFSHKGANYKLLWINQSWKSGIKMEAQWGRATKSYEFDDVQFRDRSMDEVVKFFTDIINKISSLAAAKRDMFFTPLLSEKEAKTNLQSLLDSSFQYRTEINNDMKEMMIYAEKTIPLMKGKDFTVMAYCQNRDKETRYAIHIKIGHYPITSANCISDTDILNQRLKETFDRALESVSPDSRDRGKFYYREDFDAFIGMVARLSGVKSLLVDYSQQVSLWDNLENKQEIYRDAARVY